MTTAGPETFAQSTFGPRLMCRSCKEEQGWDVRSRIEAYVRGDPCFCRACEMPFDVWEAVTRTLNESVSVSHVMGLVEAESILRTAWLDSLADRDWVEERRLTIDLAQIFRSRIPTAWETQVDRAVLWVEWQTKVTTHRRHDLPPFSGQFLVADVAGFPAHPDRKRISLQLHPPTVDPDGVVLDVWIVWVDRRSEYRLVHLADAFAAYFSGHFDQAVVSAAIAVETAVEDVVRLVLGRRIPEAAAGSLAELTNDKRVHAVLPVIAELVGYPWLPDEVTRSLKELAQRRNSMAHRGRLDLKPNGKPCKRPSRGEQVRMLAAALIAVEYAQLLERVDSDSPSDLQ